MTATLALDRACTAPGTWPRRWAVAALLAAVPLVLFGGSVTTLGAGMAVEGWLIAEGHFLLFFPVDKWFRDTATFVEHTHRLFGALVGLFALACAAATFLGESRPAARRSSVVALGAVCLQGTLGGLRVLADDTGLAFVHGALAQVVFAVLCANVVLVSSEWSQPLALPGSTAERGALRRAALFVLSATLAQVVLGAWYRHGLRPVPVAEVGLRFLLHGFGALGVLLGAAAVARAASPVRRSGVLPGSLALALRALPPLLIAQLLLGGLAWAGFRPGALGPAEWGLSIAHVLGGALLLADLGLIALWSLRASRAEVSA